MSSGVPSTRRIRPARGGLPEVSSYLVVMGAKVRRDGRPSGALARRIRAGAQHALGDPALWVIATGAVGEHPPSEADVIAEGLVEYGVPAHRVLLEREGTDTLSSVRLCAALMADRSARVERVDVCTDRFHVLRTTALFRALGLPARALWIEGGAFPMRLRSALWYWLRDGVATLWDLPQAIWLRDRTPPVASVPAGRARAALGESISIREEMPHDRARIYAAETRAFGQESEARIVDALRDRVSPWISLVAEHEGELVGHVSFSPITLEGDDDAPAICGLAPLAVDPDHQGRGIGAALIRAGLERCREAGFRAVFLVGSPEYYARFGFQLAAPRGFTYGDPHMDAALQYIELEAGALDGLSGRTVYDRAFEDLG